MIYEVVKEELNKYAKEPVSIIYIHKPISIGLSQYCSRLRNSPNSVLPIYGYLLVFIKVAYLLG